MTTLIERARAYLDGCMSDCLYPGTDNAVQAWLDEGSREARGLKAAHQFDVPNSVMAEDIKTAGRLNKLARDVYANNAHWWTDPRTGKFKDRNVGELLMLVVSEISEAMEGHRKDLMDDKLPHRKMFEVELADALIRIFDIAGRYKLDLDGAVTEKRAFNAVRLDHKHEARLAPGGKAY